MVVEAEDPITGTTWFDPSDLGGTARVWIVALLGITALLVAVGVAQNTLVPALNSVFNMVPGVSTGTASGISFDGSP